MISVATLDPSSLTLWIDFSQIGRSPAGEYLDELFAIAIGDNPKDTGRFVSRIPNAAVARRCAQVASSIWHEERHFLDLLLTNYGSFRVRQFFEIYINAGLILGDLKRADEGLHCPIYAYADPVLRRHHGLTTTNKNLTDLARGMKNRRQTLQADRLVIETAIGPIEVGGEAQLEALAVFFQVSSSLDLMDDATSWQQDVPNWRQNARYRWAEYLGEVTGVAPVIRTDDGAAAAIDATLLIPILYGSLMMRAWGQQQVESDNGGSGLPSKRFGGLLHAFRGFHFDFGQLAIGDAWNLVNEKAKELWGRSVIEEMLADYEFEENYCKQIEANDSVLPSIKTAARDYHDVRQKLIALLINRPGLVLDAKMFSTDLLPILNPLIINAVPAGVYGEAPSGTHLVYGYRHPDYAGDDGKWWWAVAHDGSGGIEMAETDAWLDIASIHAPLAKLMMNGRRHKTMLGPEIISVQKRFETIGIPIRLDPLFAFPDQEETISNLYHLQMRETVTCDWCRESVQKPNGRLISPWVFRINNQNATTVMAALGGGLRGELKFYKDWSFWVFCDKCTSDMFGTTG